MVGDLINGSFELIGGLLLWTNVRRILRDRCVHGINILPTVFFTAWGFWNLWYYPSLNQWLSFFGGLSVVLANVVWVVLTIKYRRK